MMLKKIPIKYVTGHFNENFMKTENLKFWLDEQQRNFIKCKGQSGHLPPYYDFAMEVAQSILSP